MKSGRARDRRCSSSSSRRQLAPAAIARRILRTLADDRGVRDADGLGAAAVETEDDAGWAFMACVRFSPGVGRDGGAYVLRYDIVHESCARLLRSSWIGSGSLPQ